MIDLLDRLVTDIQVRPKVRSLRKSSYSQALAEQIQRETNSPAHAEGSEVDRTCNSLPRSLVLITTETLCLNCGARYRAPCHTVFAEYDARSRSVLRDATDITKLIAWCHKHNHHPLNEHQTVYTNSPACEKCL